MPGSIHAAIQAKMVIIFAFLYDDHVSGGSQGESDRCSNPKLEAFLLLTVLSCNQSDTSASLIV
jgi:hypothetical protein